MIRLRNLSFLVLMVGLLFASCEKEPLTSTTPATPSSTPATAASSISTPTATATNAATSLRALAAAARTSHGNNEGLIDSLDNPCGCYDLFNEIDFEGSDSEIEAAVDAILEALTDDEITRLFEPVCTEDGDIIESACIADCEGIINYHTCSDDELEDYFFDELDCGNLEDINFPFDFELPDGTIVTVNSEEELFAALEQWFAANGEEWEEEWEEWEDGEWEDDCFTIIYPIDIVFPDGMTQTFNSDEELEEAMENWYETNPYSMEEPMPVYPVAVLLTDSTVLIIENEEQGEALDTECYGAHDFEEEFCFDLAYPVTVNNPDSTSTIANNEEELEAALEAIFEDTDDIEEEEAFFAILDAVIPFNIQLEDGTTQTINSLGDLELAIFSCFGGIGNQDASTAKRFFSTTSTKQIALVKQKLSTK